MPSQVFFSIELLRATGESAFDTPDGGIHDGCLLLYLVMNLHDEVLDSGPSVQFDCRESTSIGLVVANADRYEIGSKENRTKQQRTW